MNLNLLRWVQSVMGMVAVAGRRPLAVAFRVRVPGVVAARAMAVLESLVTQSEG